MFGGTTTTTIAAMRDAARAMSSVATSTADEVRALAVARDAIEAAMCERLAEMDQTKAHEDEGASSIRTWARRELHQDAGRTAAMVRAAATFRDLPGVAAAAHGSRISFEHVQAFTFALKHVGVAETVALAEPLLDLATSVTPGELFARVRRAKAVIHGDDLDKAWLRGMAKRDITISRCGDGWHLTGFLDVTTGAKLKTILTNLSVPRDAGDDRAPAERRMDALDDICTTVLEHGLPADNGIRPHVFVTVEAETLKAIADASAARTLDLDLKPAHLEGFGPIGPQLLDHLLCGAEITPILVQTIGANTKVLDVGRTERYATLKQAQAIRLQQKKTCASPGCHHPIAHIHHKQWWSWGGRTDIDNLIGLCRKCHTLVHTGQLQLTG
jgi:hypothetical protein